MNANDWAYTLLAISTLIAASYAAVAWADEFAARRHEDDNAIAWARLTRTVMQARREFGAGK